jgi:DNA-binding CsgD family transcriptional regulator
VSDQVRTGDDRPGGQPPRGIPALLPPPLPPDGFTPRQLQVVRLLAVGHSATEIGAVLGISARTARMHCDVLRVKLAVTRSRQIPHAFFARTGVDPFVERA